MLLILTMLTSATGQDASHQPSGGISGFVRYPDGTPSAGATVYGRSQCEGMGYSVSHEVKTSTDGSFYFPPLLEATCGRVRLSADKREDRG